MSRLANWLYRISEKWAHRLNKEPRVVIGPGGPTVRWVAPQSTKEYGWDDSHYHKGSLHVKGVYNPLKLTKEEVEDDNPKVDVIASENYKAAIVANEIIPKALAPMDMGQLKMYIMGAAGLSLLTLFAVIGLYT